MSAGVQHHCYGESSLHVRNAISSLGPELLSIDQVAFGDGTDVDLYDNDGLTALHGEFEATKVLLEDETSAFCCCAGLMPKFAKGQRYGFDYPFVATSLKSASPKTYRVRTPLR